MGDESHRRQEGAMPRLTFAFCGDIIWSRHVHAVATRRGIDHLFLKIAPLVRRADCVLANLEGCISTRGTPMDNKAYTFRAPPELAPALRRAGISTVTLGNNHAMDYGAVALQDTFVHLERAGVCWAGAGTDVQHATQPIWVEAKGVRVAIVCFTAIVPGGFAARRSAPGVATFEHILPRLPEVRRQADVLIAVPHWGVENEHAPSPKQKRMARLLHEAGVDLIVGHHSHVVQGYERIGQTHVLYSVGNLVHTPRSVATRRAGILWAEVHHDGVSNLRFIPLWLQYGQPMPAPRAHAQALARLVAPLPCADH
ncbi:MAG: hypothetical protein C4335_02915 [Armatimonadota bacterium]